MNVQRVVQHRRYVVLAAITAAAALAAGCGSSGEGSGESTGADAPVKGATASSVNYRPAGFVAPAEIKKGINICYFGDGSDNGYVLANNAGAAAAAKKLGVGLTTQLGNWDPARQLNQIQSGISSGKCSGLVVEPIDPTAVCKVLTEDAPKAKIPVVVVNIPICGAVDKAPNTVAFSGSQTLGYNNAYLDWAFGQAAKRWPGEQVEVGAITGPANWAGTLPPHGIKQAYTNMAKKYPDVKVVQMLAGDFTTEAGLNSATTIMQAHPKVKMLIGSVDEHAAGAIKSLQAAGKKPGDVLVFSLGYNQVSKKNIGSGWQTGSMVLAPVQEIGEGVEAMAAHLSGKEVPSYIKPTLGASSETVTKENLDEVKPEW